MPQVIGVNLQVVQLGSLGSGSKDFPAFAKVSEGEWRPPSILELTVVLDNGHWSVHAWEEVCVEFHLALKLTGPSSP